MNILLDTMNYDDASLCLDATQLLYDIYCPDSLLLTSINSVHLVSPALTPFLKKIVPLATTTDETKVFSKLMLGEVDTQRNPHLLDTLEDLCQSCVNPHDNNEPAICEQKIIYSSGKSISICSPTTKAFVL